MGAMLSWWLGIEALGLVGLPLASRLFSADTGRGYAYGKILAVLGVTWLAWVAGFLGLPYGTALALAVVLFLALNLALAWQGRAELTSWLGSGGWREILITDAIWTIAFLFFAWQRSLQPQIVDQEKFMDFAFFNGLIRAESMPPEDPWMAGKTFNYYYFGYLMVANLARLFAAPSHVAYNLCVATIAGLTFTQLSAVGTSLTRRRSLGLLAGGLGIVLGNIDGLLQILSSGTLFQMDYFRSTRVVGGGDTINEFPFFTAIHGDLHPHFLVMPVSILLLGLLLDPARARRAAERGFETISDLGTWAPVAFVLGTMVAISTWELPVGAMTTFLLLHRGVPLLPLVSRPRLRILAATVGMLVAGYVFFLPFYLHFVAPQGGVGIKLATTSMAEFLTVFGGLLALPTLFLLAWLGTRLPLSGEWRQFLGAVAALVVVAGILSGKGVLLLMAGFALAAFVASVLTEDPDERAPLLLLLAAAAALLACEIVYIKDPYGDRLYRMNTVFKLYLQAWFLLSVAVPWCLGKLLEPGSPLRSWRVPGLAVTAAILVATVGYPAGVTASRIRYQKVWWGTLDGNAYLARDHADDFAVIQWLREKAEGQPTVLETSGNPYSYYARISSNTGLPTVMGWANHEGLWRSHEPEVEKRKRDVARIYSAATMEEVRPLLDQYGVRYVVVGDLERKDHPGGGLAKFESLRVAFRSGTTTLYER